MRTITTKAIALLITFSVATFAQQKGTLTDSRDKKNYKTVKIGTQTWMAENLAYQVQGSVCYGEGDNECVKVDINAADDAIVCSKNKKLSAAEIQANCKKYGRLYDGGAAETACPAGWRLPSENDWNILLNFAGGDEVGKNKLKAKSGWKNGTDAYGFAALPGGYFSSSFTEEYNDGNYYFVSAGIGGSWQPYFLIGDNNFRVGPSKSSIRCLKISAEEEAAEKAAAEKAAADKAAADKAAKKTEQPKPAEQPKQKSANENCSLTFPKKSCVSMPNGACKMAGGKVVDKCP